MNKEIVESWEGETEVINKSYNIQSNRLIV